MLIRSLLGLRWGSPSLITAKLFPAPDLCLSSAVFFLFSSSPSSLTAALFPFHSSPSPSSLLSLPTAAPAGVRCSAAVGNKADVRDGRKPDHRALTVPDCRVTRERKKGSGSDYWKDAGKRACVSGPVTRLQTAEYVIIKAPLPQPPLTPPLPCFPS